LDAIFCDGLPLSRVDGGLKPAIDPLKRPQGLIAVGVAADAGGKRPGAPLEDFVVPANQFLPGQ
jgi:hypothetical protein